MPVSAHNCYPPAGPSDARLKEALALGLDNIEIDVGWDESRRRLIVGHDAAPRAGAVYAELEAYLVPALEAHWKTRRADGAPHVLTIDWKTSHPEAVRRFAQFLDAHADWFSSAPKAAESPMTVRRLTVCLTGSDEAKAHFDRLIADGGTYRAFRDRVHGGGDYRDDAAAYVPEPATGYHRFLTFHWGVIERGGPPLAGEWTKAEAGRLRALVARAHDRGFRIRVYCLDAPTAGAGFGYAFANPVAARARWRAAAAAGVDWIATDDYAEIVRALSP